MGLFNAFPWTNFHELNLDWIIQKLKDIEAQIPEGLIGIAKGGTGADNAADARTNLEISGETVPLYAALPQSIADVIGIIQGNIGDLDDMLKYRIFKTVSSLSLTPGSCTIYEAWIQMSGGDLLLCAPSEFSAGQCPESFGVVFMVRPASGAGSCLFMGENHAYRKNYSANVPTAGWEQIYTNGDTIPITHGGTGATTAAQAIQNLGIDFSGTVLSVAGVGADPTGDVPLTATDLGVRYTMIYAASQAGLAGTPSLTDLFTAMPAHSVFIGDVTQIASADRPGSGSLLIIKLSSTRGIVYCFAVGSATRDYKKIVTGSNTLGPWISLPGPVTETLLTKTFPNTLTGASYLYTDGHQAILNLDFRYSTGFPAETWTELYALDVAPSRTFMVAQQFAGQSCQVRVTNAGKVEIYPNTSPYTYSFRANLTFFY